MLKKALFVIVVCLFVSSTSASGAVIDLPLTGQTKCYDTSGTEVTCTGTGQDGEYQAGTGWPSKRFTKIYCDASGPCANQAADCDGNASTDMIKDNLTGLIWARDGDLPASLKYWADGLTYANDLTLCGYSDWRLPNVNELGSLYNSGQSDLNAWLASQGFVNPVGVGYWSSTSVDTTTGPGVWAWVLEGGSIIASPKSRGGIDLRPLWPVRGTTNGVAKIPQTGQTTCYDAAGAVISCAVTGQDGEFMEGAAWPAPRFTVVYCDDNGPCTDQEIDCDASESNDLVLDNLTSLVWTKDANLPAGTETWADALTYANNASVCGYTDWRIPNREEFRSLANYGTSDLPVWLNVEGGFINVPLQTNNCLYWTSTTSASSTGNAWIFRIRAYPYSNFFLYGSIAPMVKTEPLYVWPVRGGCSAPDAPDLISPLNVAVGVSLTPTLDWSYVSRATSYDVRVCSNSTCSSVMRSKNVTSSQWTVSPALNQGTTCYWRVRSKHACGNSSWSNIRSFTTIIAKPNSPSQLSAKATSSSSIVLTWKDNSNDETGFKIERKIGSCSSTNSWELIATKGANATTHTNTGLATNTTYSYRVKAYNAGGNSAYSNCASAKTALSGTPKAPTNLTATSLSASQIKLTWTDNSTNEGSFKVYRKVGSGSWGFLATKGANIVSHTDTTATGNTATDAYSYYVQACNSSGCSPATNTAIVPYKPTNLTATAPSSSRIDLAWADKSSNETGFQIYRKSGVCSSPSAWGLIATKGVDSTSHSNTGLSSGTTYSYKVRAYKKSSAMPYAYGYSLYSNCKSATTQ